MAALRIILCYRAYASSNAGIDTFLIKTLELAENVLTTAGNVTAEVTVFSAISPETFACPRLLLKDAYPR